MCDKQQGTVGDEMGALFQDDAELDYEEMQFTVRVPRHLPLGIVESLEEGMTKAVDILAQGAGFSRIVADADDVARLVISQTVPSRVLISDRMAMTATIKKVFDESDWLAAADIHALQPNRGDKKAPAKKSLPASDWKRRGRIFSVPYDGADYFPSYQFDAAGQPLPVIKDILEAYGDYADAWSVATWFHFPNGWIAQEVGGAAVAVAPKDALDRAADVIHAAHNRKGAYVA